LVRRQFRVKSPSVVDETIEGEVIVINLESGNYYSLRGTSAEIWHAIKAGADEVSIGDSLSGRYAAEQEEIASAVTGLLDELDAEGLIEQTAEGAAPAERPSAPSEQGGRVPFIAPALERYTDMHDLILLDPVHDVSEAGWPHVASTRAEA
jgi:hypothetical protein